MERILTYGTKIMKREGGEKKYEKRKKIHNKKNEKKVFGKYEQNIK